MAEYELLVIGSGPGGYVAAIKAAQLGMGKIGIIESREIGGTCLNRGCIPTKTFMHSAELVHEMEKGESLGILSGEVKVDMKKLSQRKNEVIFQLQSGIEGLLKSNQVEIISGQAKIVEAGKVQVGEEVLTAEKILIATGSKPIRLPVEGMDLPAVCTSDEILGDPDGKLFQEVVIVGGGVIGVEFATLYNAFGCDVTLIEGMDRILPTLDREISQNLQMILKKRGVKIFTSTMVQRITEEKEKKIVYFQVKEKEESLSVDGVLVSIGRKANTEELFSETCQPKMEKGMIAVNNNYETSIPGIYAIGDVTYGTIQLAHVASAQGINAVCGMMKTEPAVNMSVVPSCIYTIPEIALVGLNADEAKQAGIAVKVGKFIMSANCKNTIVMADRGFVKAIFREEDDVLIGAQIMSPRATDMISEFSVGIVNQMTIHDLSKVIHPHPTFSEGLAEAIEDAAGQAIHIMPKKKIK